MSNRIQTLAWQLPMPNASDKSVLAKLADNANDEGECHPAWKRIEREASVKTATLSDILKAFECFGLVTREKRKRKNGANSSNKYHVNIPEFSKAEINQYWEEGSGVVFDYIESYTALRNALTAAKKGKSVALFTQLYKEHKEGQKEGGFVAVWNEVYASSKGIKSDALKSVFETTFRNHTSPNEVAHTSPDEVAHTSPDEVAHTSPDEVAHTSPDEVAHTSPDEVAHTSPDEVATIEPSVSFNHHISLTSKNTMSWIEVSQERKALIRDEIQKIEEPNFLSLEDFENALEAKGYKYKSFVAAYRQWLSSAKKNGKAQNNVDAELIIQTPEQMIQEGNW